MSRLFTVGVEAPDREVNDIIADNVRKDGDGDLVLTVSGGEVRLGVTPAPREVARFRIWDYWYDQGEYEE